MSLDVGGGYVKMTDKDRDWARPPRGGEWFKRIEAAYKYADTEYGVGKGFVCGWEMPLVGVDQRSPGYFFGVYAGYQEFMHVCMELKDFDRHGFEVIRATRECNLYFDLEWYGEEDWDKILRIMNVIRVYIVKKFGINFALQILRGSRLDKKKGFKNSLHVVVTGLSFTNNFGGAMKICVIEIVESSHPDDRSSFDTGVYTRGRLMRTEMSCKRGTQVPLHNITGDPFSSTSTLFSTRVYADCDVGALGNFSITHHVHDNVDVVLVQGDAVSSSVKRDASVKRKKNSAGGVDDTVLTECGHCFTEEVTRDLMSMVSQTQSVGCEVTGKYAIKGGHFFAQMRNSGTRLCIATDCGYTHDNEHAFLSFHGGHVEYRCFSSNCKNSSFVLGQYPTSLKAYFAAHASSKAPSLLESMQSAGAQCDEEYNPANAALLGEDVLFKSHFRFPKLLERHLSKAIHIDKPYLHELMFDDGKRIHLVESSCNTGKTTSVFTHAGLKNIRILALAARVTQVDAHEAVVLGRHEKYVRYDSASLDTALVGEIHLLSTVDSVWKIVAFLKRHPEYAKLYILFIDEFDSIVQYLYSSTTLLQKRRSVLKDIQWLIRNTYQVIAADNIISNHDFYFIETALSETETPADVTFHVNSFQTFKGVPAMFVSDREEWYQMIKAQNDLKEGFVVVCNTKAEARYLCKRLYDDTVCPIRRASIRYYDGDTSSTTNIPDEVLRLWDGFPVVYTPKITTGVDFHPKNPTNVYCSILGETTVCPATAIQMITRTRNIKNLYMYVDRMRTTPRFGSVREMNAHLDIVLKTGANSQEFSTLLGLVDVTWSSDELDDVYTENKFSKGYRGWLWHDNVMQGQWPFNFKFYSEKRGFVFISRLSLEGGPSVDPSFRKQVLKMCMQDLRREFMCWRKGKETPHFEIFDKRLVEIRQLSLNGNDEHHEDYDHLLNAKMHLNSYFEKLKGYDCFWTRVRVNSIFMNLKAFQNNQIIRMAMYTREKLNTIQSHNHKVEFNLPNAKSVCTLVLLLRELITVFNVGMPANSRLRIYDISMHQSQYNEDSGINVTDAVWRLYVYACQSVKKQPTTRKSLLTAIFFLSQKLFGKYFTTKNETSRLVPSKKNGVKKLKCYNYVGDDMFLRVHVGLTDWSKVKLSDLEPAIVKKYKLKAYAARVYPLKQSVQQPDCVATQNKRKNPTMDKYLLSTSKDRDPKRHKPAYL